MKVNALIFLTPVINTICQTDNFIHPFLNYITQFYKDNVKVGIELDQHIYMMHFEIQMSGEV